MTRKDYVLIAAAFRRVRRTEPTREAAYALECLARELADDLARDNFRFDRARFLAACAAEVEKEAA